MNQKYEGLADIAKKLQALDNEVKLKILSLLIEQGSKSITDISKGLNINFSTTHKYLELLEKANLVTSKQVSDNRLKRLFFVKDFSIDLSPTGISNITNAKQSSKLNKNKLHVINEKGEEVLFDDKLFALKYLKRGLPRGIIVNALSFVLQQTYDGITLLEMRDLFRKALVQRTEKIRSVLKQIEKSDKHKRTYAHLLELVHPEALKQHMIGDIFISNLREPKLLNFIHDLRGIAIHGVDGKQPKTLSDLFDQTLSAIKFVSTYTMPLHVIDSFNYFIAPFAKNERNLHITINKFLEKLEASGNNIILNIDMGLPKFVSKILPDYIADGATIPTNYEDYRDVAEKIAEIVTNITKQKKLSHITLLYKLWTKDQKLIKTADNYCLVNMNMPWQTNNATYVGTTRFDTNWKGWNRTVRIGEAQNITINLPRIALKSKNEKEFSENLKKLIDQCIEYSLNMAELALGEFIRKHKTELPSVQKRKWDYLHVEDCRFSISMLGLEETMQILTKKGIKENLPLLKKVLGACQKRIQDASKFRMGLKIEVNPIIAERFYILDSKQFNVKFSRYSPGITCDDPKAAVKLHKYLLGGHCTKINKKDLKNLSEFGAVLITK